MNVKVSARLTPTVSPKSRVMLGRYLVARQQTTIHVNVKLVSKVSSPQYKESYRMLVQYNLYYLEAPGHYYIPYIPFRCISKPSVVLECVSDSACSHHICGSLFHPKCVQSMCTCEHNPGEVDLV